jgi:hypothetical protein
MALLCSAFPARLRAACKLPPLMAEMAVHSEESTPGDPGLSQYNLGLVYLDGGCLPEATAAFRNAVSALTEHPKADAEEQARLLGLSQEGARLTAALGFVRTDPKEAIRLLLNLVKTQVPSQVALRANLALAGLLEPASPAWSDLESELEILSGIGYLPAEQGLANHLIRTGRAGAAIDRLERRLAAAQDLQEAFALQIFLADAYRQAGRLVEARLLLATLLPQAGEELLDASLRFELVRVAADVARARVQAGEADAQRELDLYSAALEEMHPP